MIIRVDNYTGEAALVVYDDYAVLAHRGPRGLFVVGKTYNIQSTDWVIVSNTPSSYTSGVVNVKMRKLL